MCESITIYDLQTYDVWYFKVEKLFSVIKDGITQYTITPVSIEQLNINTKAKRLWTKEINQVHTWNLFRKYELNWLSQLWFLHKFCVGRADSANFSNMKRLTVILSIITTTYALTLAFYGFPRFEVSDGISSYGHFGFYGIVFLISFGSSVISFLLNLGITFLFR